jgi:hypothetical protein
VWILIVRTEVENNAQGGVRTVRRRLHNFLGNFSGKVSSSFLDNSSMGFSELEGEGGDFFLLLDGEDRRDQGGTVYTSAGEFMEEIGDVWEVFLVTTKNIHQEDKELIGGYINEGQEKIKLLGII